ncbi:MAG: MarR family transcriptional regulator [Sebaldella sp.]|nr:MarR family transcriptional regulator [Sebaldella sp.]
MNKKTLNLFGQFARVEWLLHRYHQHNHRVHGPMGDPHRGQGRILALLKMQPEISQKDLVFLLDMRPQSLGELLMKLERAGYITRTPSEADRRVMNIKLTDEGAKVTEHQNSFEKLFNCLNEEEQEILSGYLNRITEGLEKQFSEDGLDYHGDEDRHGRHGRDFDPRERRHHRHPHEDHFGPRGMDRRVELERKFYSITEKLKKRFDDDGSEGEFDYHTEKCGHGRHNRDLDPRERRGCGHPHERHFGPQSEMERESEYKNNSDLREQNNNTEQGQNNTENITEEEKKK